MSLYETNADVWKAVRNHFMRPDAVFGYDADNMTCTYRGPKGEKCAVGCLIPDDRYIPALEGKAIATPGTWDERDVNVYDFLIGAGVIGPEVSDDFLRDLQLAHDDNAQTGDSSVITFLYAAEQIASSYEAL